MLKKIIGAAILSMAFAVSAQAFQITSGISSGGEISVKSTNVTVRGTVTKTSQVNRVIDYLDPVTGQRTQGALNENETATTYVKVDSYGSGVSYSGYIGGSNSVGALAVGYQASGGVDQMHTDTIDTSVTDVDGVAVTNVIITVAGAYVGSVNEVVDTDTRVERNNWSGTDSQGTWGQFLVYAQ